MNGTVIWCQYYNYLLLRIGAQIASVPGTQCYYTNYRMYYRYHWKYRALSESIKSMEDVDGKDCCTLRQRLASETGFTGLSILHRLHHL